MFNQIEIDLNSPKVDLIKASPGSGKTTLFAETFEYLIKEQWKEPFIDLKYQGIAALSHTNVAKNIIRKAVGEVNNPHFIDTLSAFIIKYIFLPYRTTLGIVTKELVILEESNYNKYKPDDNTKITVANGFYTDHFSIIFEDGTIDSNIKAKYYHRFDQTDKYISQNYIIKILEAKMSFWNQGIYTYNDIYFLANSIIMDIKFQNEIINTIIKRFPVILIDEFQDTNQFVARIFLKLIEKTKYSLVVGDMDQYIFDFSGGNPQSFNEFQSFSNLNYITRNNTYRFGQDIANISSLLSFEGINIDSEIENEEDATILLVHNYEKISYCEKFNNLINEFSNNFETAIILSHENGILNALKKPSTKAEAKNYNPFSFLDKGLNLYRNGNSQEALNVISNGIGRIVINLKYFNIDKENKEFKKEWNKHIVKIIDIYSDTESLYLDRIDNLVEYLDSMCNAYNNKNLQEFNYYFVNTTILNFKNTVEIDYPKPKPTRWSDNIDFITVHSSKGREFDFICYFLPLASTTKYDKCLCEILNNKGDNIFLNDFCKAFVALTRAKKRLVLCIHENCFTALYEKHKEFIELFNKIEHIEDDKFICPNTFKIKEFVYDF